MRIAAALAALAAFVFASLLFMKAGERPAHTLPESGEGVVEAVSVPRALPAAAEPPAAEPAAPEAPAAVQAPRTIRFEEATAAPAALEEAVCLRFGPVAESRLPKLRGRIERSGQLDRMLIEPADTAERFVFAGPYASQEKARRALESLRKAGLEGGGVEAHGDVWVVALAHTKSRPTAERWAREVAAAFGLTNVVVEERGRRRGMVSLVFPNLSLEENGRIRGALGASEGGSFSACPF